MQCVNVNWQTIRRRQTALKLASLKCLKAPFPGHFQPWFNITTPITYPRIRRFMFQLSIYFSQKLQLTCYTLRNKFESMPPPRAPKKKRCRFPKALAWIVLLYAITKAKNIARAEEISPDHASTTCIAENNICAPEIVGQSMSCKPKTFVKAQSCNCLVAACIYSRRTPNQVPSICTSGWTMTSWCSKFFFNPCVLRRHRPPLLLFRRLHLLKPLCSLQLYLPLHI